MRFKARRSRPTCAPIQGRTSGRDVIHGEAQAAFALPAHARGRQCPACEHTEYVRTYYFEHLCEPQPNARALAPEFPNRYGFPAQGT